MKKTILAMVVAALALAGCGDDTIKPMSVARPGAEPGAAVTQPATAAAPAQAPQHAESGSSWFMPAVIGYLLGSSMNRPAAPQAQAAPSYTPPAPARSNWWSRNKPADKQVATPAPVRPQPAPTKPPVLSTSPKNFSVPKFAAAPKPSYSGPSSYKAPTYSFKPSTPSRSFSSGRR